ncbi:hypothetical protein V4S36_09230 [Enterococcus cecorum]|uniref:hypothetical protein n=1 Tax=Enterococcus cecorum TaxID=44008 RepID=UPI0022D17339|nr:hypothetical protein CIRMBP1253_02084 [Enterococcus cecorum]CAI3462823.1 hypothetical protein CIRMBP1275_02001 [Enterococcus cecorum]
MTQKYLQISATKETRRIFNEYFEKNKEYFGTKASMFRFMVYNLDILTKFNSKIVNPEKKKLEKELREAKEKIMEYELKLGKQKELKAELPENVTDQLDRIEKMVAIIFESDLIKVSDNKTSDKIKYDFDFKF